MVNNAPISTPLRAAVDARLEDFTSRQIAHASSISPHYAELWSDIDRLMHAGGKRLRSQIALLSYQMFGGKDVDAIIPAAASLELLHLGMLIHDDIIDRDNVRYGVPNITGSYGKKYSEFITKTSERTHHAQSAALLAGDLLLSSSYLLMAEATIAPNSTLEIQQLLGKSIFEVIGGELIDTESAFRATPNTQSAERIALYKTASYSFTLPLLLGATLAGLPENDKPNVLGAGKNLGIAFQLRDDILGIFGDESKTGKSVSGDIREGKRTYMVEQFYAVSSHEQRAAFDQHFGSPDITAEQVAEIRSLLVDSGALEKTESAIAMYETRARESLSKLEINPEYAAALEALIGITTVRNA